MDTGPSMHPGQYAINVVVLSSPGIRSMSWPGGAPFFAAGLAFVTCASHGPRKYASTLNEDAHAILSR